MSLDELAVRAEPDALPFRTGYLSLLLPVKGSDEQLRHTIRSLVIDALSATGEWPRRVDIVTRRRVDDGQMTRWFVEYETGSPR